MCAACGMVTHVPVFEDDRDEPVVNPTTTVKFAALRNPACRIYLAGGMLARMADNTDKTATITL